MNTRSMGSEVNVVGRESWSSSLHTSAHAHVSRLRQRHSFECSLAIKTLGPPAVFPQFLATTLLYLRI